VVHMGMPEAEQVADVQPTLEGRTARCLYATGSPTVLVRECNYGQPRGEHGCTCTDQPSRLDLPFFTYQPEKAQDQFFCGCMGWD